MPEHGVTHDEANSTDDQTTIDDGVKAVIDEIRRVIDEHDIAEIDTGPRRLFVGEPDELEPRGDTEHVLVAWAETHPGEAAMDQFSAEHADVRPAADQYELTTTYMDAELTVGPASPQQIPALRDALNAAGITELDAQRVEEAQR